MDKKFHAEWEGRKLDENEDGSLTLTLSREDTLESAIQIYAEYLHEQEKKYWNTSFGDWLSDELRKVREERIIKEYGGKNGAY